MKAEVSSQYIHRLLEPGPVVIVTSRYRNRINALSVGWSSAMGMTPPLVGIVLSEEHLSTELIRKGEQFVVNIPGLPLAEAVLQVGSMSGRDVEDKIERVGLELEEPRRLDTPHLARALAWIECAVIDAPRVGSSILFVGEVVGAWAEQEAFDQVWLLRDEEAKPLHHLGGNVFGVIEKQVLINKPQP